ncbi:MAG: hypothetical protein E6J24_03170 [Chloroflexi bacterium]|nr:MAG: hypothetical protein E6J24_03170 [Chloroflexota bacterium]
MSLEALIPSAIDGLMLGFVYGLAAMGLTLIFGVMRVINLSHGPVIALGMFVVYTLFTGPLGVNPYLGIVAALVIGLAFGVVEYFVALDRVINAPELTTLLATFSVNLMIIGIATSGTSRSSGRTPSPCSSRSSSPRDCTVCSSAPAWASRSAPSRTTAPRPSSWASTRVACSHSRSASGRRSPW